MNTSWAEKTICIKESGISHSTRWIYASLANITVIGVSPVDFSRFPNNAIFIRTVYTM